MARKVGDQHPSRRPALHHPPIPHAPEPHLGLAGNVARAYIDSPLSPLLFFATLLLGLIGLIMTPRQEDPEISVPMIDVLIQYPGASARQVAAIAIDPLQRMMSEIPGVKHVYSAAQREQGIVTVRFEVGEDFGESIVKVHDKLQSNLDKIPPGVSPPLVQPKGIDDVPIVTLTLWSHSVDDVDLRKIGFQVMQRLEEVPETGRGFVIGGSRNEIQVKVLPERMHGYNISLDQLAAAIRHANTRQSVGDIEITGQHFKVTAGTFLRSAEDVQALLVGTHMGVPVYVRDLAEVSDGAAEATEIVSMYTGLAFPDELLATDGANAVTVAIAKKQGANGVTVADRLLRRVDDLKASDIPPDVHVLVSRNYGKTATDKVNELLGALLEAAVAVSFLCLIAIGLRASIVVIVVIPVVILMAIWAAWMLDFSINRVSLFALVFAIGILVDDATVVAENIFRRWLRDEDVTIPTAVDAVREVGNPTIVATFAILAALLPMGFVSGMMGPYMFPIPLLGSMAMLFSLVAAFVFTPWFSWQLRPPLKTLKRAEEKEKRIQETVGRFYRPLIRPLLKKRTAAWMFLIALLIVFFASLSMFYFRAVTVKMLPFDNKGEFSVVVNMPEGTALPCTANLTHRMVKALQQVPEVTAMQSYVGTAAPFNFNGLVRHYYLRREPWQAEIQVMLTDKDDRARSSHELATTVRALLQPIANEKNARISVVEMPPGPPVLQTMVAEVYGPDADTRRENALKIRDLFEEVPNLVDVDDYLIDEHEIWHFEVDSEKAVRRGVGIETVVRTIDMVMGGYRLGDIKLGHGLEPTYIVMQSPLQVRADLKRLHDLPVQSAVGVSVPLGELGRFVQLKEDPIIYAKDLARMEYVVGEMEGRFGAPIYGMLAVEELLADYETGDGMTMSGTLTGPPEDTTRSGFEWSGEWTVTYETFRDLGIAFAAALVLIFILLVWEFGNFIHPLIVMAPIPLTLIGIIPGHWLLNAEFTATSMIGFIALAGIEVRNSILLVDFAKNEIRRGQTVEEAVVRSGQTRMRPIWVTNITMMAGAAALMFDPIFQGMAISLLFGALIATTLTLIVVPLGCISAAKAFELCPQADVGADECVAPDPAGKA
jgi:multidrug efflux pump subunit AcrB